jgi:membrane dipeptidase
VEQIDIAKLIMAKYPKQFQFAVTSKDIRKAHKAGKMAGLIGIEGCVCRDDPTPLICGVRAHQLGNSLAVLRQYRELGVRYMTLTHACQ